MSHSKTIQAEKSYGPGTDMRKSAEKFDIRKSDRNNLMAKVKALKILTTINLSVRI